MANHLTEGWPLGPTSTVYMSGEGLYHVRRHGKPGILATVKLPFADAAAIRVVVQEALQDARAQGWNEAVYHLEGVIGSDLRREAMDDNPYEGVVDHG